MGAVFEAEDLEGDVRVAVKTVLQHDDADAMARFKHEFRALQDIHHPNLVRLGELVADESGAFFTMELVEGVDLVTWVRGEARSAESTTSKTIAEARRMAEVTLVDPPPSGVVGRPARRSAPSVPAPVPTNPAFDEARLRDAFRQVALGLSALHEAHRVHRDVKPSNVLVTPEGRVVLLDFGLVANDDLDASSTDLEMAGTPGYMAPEQVMGEPVGPEADWYAMGVVLYQCLTGRRPFEGNAVQVLHAKCVEVPPRPSLSTDGLPPDLDELCVRLLSLDKAARPAARDLLEHLHATAPGQVSLSQSGSVPFVGRASELVELARGLGDVVGGGTVTLVIEGESGVGKSSLVKRFVDEVLPSHADHLLLAGRCYEREAVPYKAFDEIVDSLSRKVARLPDDELLSLMPSHVEDLVQLFPAFRRVPLMAQQAGTPEFDPHERRKKAFASARELFARLGRQKSVVLVIDDLQWADADSRRLLTELLHPPGAPSLLLVATMRHSPEASGEPSPVLSSLPGDVRRMHLDRLSPADARELASRLLDRMAPGAADAHTIADEADGHPLFIDELVRHAATASGPFPSLSLRLDDALAARVERLEDAARDVLDIVCVLGAPTAQDTVANAAALDIGEFSRVAALLRTSNLVRTRGARIATRSSRTTIGYASRWWPARSPSACGPATNGSRPRWRSRRRSTPRSWPPTGRERASRFGQRSTRSWRRSRPQRGSPSIAPRASTKEPSSSFPTRIRGGSPCGASSAMRSPTPDRACARRRNTSAQPVARRAPRPSSCDGARRPSSCAAVG